MNSFLDRIYLDNSVRDYLWVLGVILFVLILNRLISKYLAILLCKVFRRAWKTFDQQKFVDLIIVPLGTFLVISVSIITLYRLDFPSAFNIKIYKYTLEKILLSIGIAIQVIVFIWLILRIIDFIASVLEIRANQTPNQSDNQLIVFFRDFLKVIVGIIGVMMLLHFAFNYNISSLLTGLSIVGAAIALALRESLENLIASFVIFFDKPFTTGDFVKVQSVSGTVERIGLRSTRVRTADKSYVTVPNKQMVDSILDNVSLRSQIRGEINLFINLKSSPEQIEQLIAEIKKYLSSIPEVQSHTVLFNDIRVQAFMVFIEFFTPPMQWSQFTAIKQQVNFFILQTMEKLEIKITAEGKDIAIVP
ncbi:MAG TPA: mechanosensitive ion channel domain-containing protein [Flavisolibacter sp.]|nr:mechanosensitive ion channel domain-containing protein [Flavisolibacter sp.]